MRMTLRTLGTGILIIFVLSFLSGCGTVTPDPLESNEASYDSTTPMNYDNQNSGIVALVRVGGMTLGAKITDQKRDQYNDLISKYRIQFKQRYSVTLDKDSGLTESEDQYGNHLWFINVEHLQYFMRLVRWEKEGLDPDTLFMRAKDKI